MSATPTGPPPGGGVALHSAVLTPLSELAPHPRNYRSHPEDQIAHIRASLREFGFYRNVLAARDGTILSGHGVVEAATLEEMAEIPVIFLDMDPDSGPALKVLALENTLTKFGFDDDRALTDLLKDVSDLDDLIGTGYDATSLAALVMVTRPEHEIKDFDAAAEWVGMPDFTNREDTFQLVITFDTEKERSDFVEELGADPREFNSKTWGLRFPIESRAHDEGSLYWS